MAENEQTSSYRTVIDKTGPSYGGQRGSTRGRGRGDRGAKQFTQWRGEKTAYRGGDNNRVQRGRGRAYRGGAEFTESATNETQPPSHQSQYVKRGDYRPRGSYEQRNQYQGQSRGRGHHTGGYHGTHQNKDFSSEKPAYSAETNQEYHTEQQQPYEVEKQPSGEVREATPYQNKYVTRQKRGGPPASNNYERTSYANRQDEPIISSSRGRGRGGGGPREPIIHADSAEITESVDEIADQAPLSEVSDPNQVQESTRPKPHYQKQNYHSEYSKPFYNKQQNLDGGYYDKMNFYILPDKSFYDPDGYFFGPDGYDKTGGHYDEFNKYHPAKNSSSQLSYGKPAYQKRNDYNGDYKPRHEHKPYYDRERQYGGERREYNNNYQRDNNRESRPPYQNNRAPRQNSDADSFLAPVSQARRGGGASAHQASVRTGDENAPYAQSSRGRGRGDRGGHSGGPRQLQDRRSYQTHEEKTEDLSEQKTQSNDRYKEPSQGHQGSPDLQPQHAQSKPDEEDEEDSIFLRKAANAEKKGGDGIEWLEAQISSNDAPGRQNEANQNSSTAWMNSFNKPENRPQTHHIEENFAPNQANQEQYQHQSQHQQNSGNPEDPNQKHIDGDIMQNNLILEQQRRQLAILQYYQEQQQFAIKQQTMRLAQQPQTDQPNMNNNNFGEQHQQPDRGQQFYQQQQFNQEQQENGQFIDYGFEQQQQQQQPNNMYQNQEGGEEHQQYDPNVQYYQQDQMYQEDYQQNNFNNYQDNQQVPDQFQGDYSQMNGPYYAQQESGFQEADHLMQNLNLEAAAFVPNAGPTEEGGLNEGEQIAEQE